MHCVEFVLEPLHLLGIVLILVIVYCPISLRNFRGGPPSPMHPLPSDDGRLLGQRARNGNDAS
jgi:hypothetical protein